MDLADMFLSATNTLRIKNKRRLCVVAACATVGALMACSDPVVPGEEAPVYTEVVRLTSDEAESVFRDATAAFGLDQVGPVELCIAPADMDGDGLEDLLFWRDGEPLIFRRSASGGFEEVVATVVGDSGEEAFVRGRCCAAADLDGDGNRDIVVAGLGDGVLVLWGEGAFEYEQQSYELTGDFASGDTYVTPSPDQPFHSPGIVLTDGNLDGLIDLYVLRVWEDSLVTRLEPRSPFVGTHDREECCPFAEGETRYFCGGSAVLEQTGPRNQYLVQTSEREFVDRSQESGANLPRSTWAASLIHADDDGLPDLLLGNDFDSNSVLLGLGDGRFEAISADESGLDVNNHAMGIAAADFNSDGHTDFALSQIGLPMFVVGHGDGSYEEVFPIVGGDEADELPLSWGLTFFDLDLDGDQDLYLTVQYIGENLDCWANVASGIYNGVGDFAPEEMLAIQRNLLLLNTGGQFEIVPHAPPVGDYRGTIVAVPVDLDGDLDEDILTLEVRVGDKERVHLRAWENTFEGNHRASIRLGNQLTNAEAIGTRVSIQSADTMQTFVIGGSDGYSGQRGHQLIVGLGGWSKVQVRVALPGATFGSSRWLSSGDDVALNLWNSE